MNTIHTDPEERAYLLTEEKMACPYRGNEPAPDAAIQLAILDIYRKTRELVKDGCGKNNFLMFNGKAYCVDVDLMRNGGVRFVARSLRYGRQLRETGGLFKNMATLKAVDSFGRLVI